MPQKKFKIEDREIDIPNEENMRPKVDKNYIDIDNMISEIVTIPPTPVIIDTSNIQNNETVNDENFCDKKQNTSFRSLRQIMDLTLKKLYTQNTHNVKDKRNSIQYQHDISNAARYSYTYKNCGNGGDSGNQNKKGRVDKSEYTGRISVPVDNNYKKYCESNVYFYGNKTRKNSETCSRDGSYLDKTAPDLLMNPNPLITERRHTITTQLLKNLTNSTVTDTYRSKNNPFQKELDNKQKQYCPQQNEYESSNLYKNNKYPNFIAKKKKRSVSKDCSFKTNNKYSSTITNVNTNNLFSRNKPTFNVYGKNVKENEKEFDNRYYYPRKFEKTTKFSNKARQQDAVPYLDTAKLENPFQQPNHPTF